MPRTVMCQGDRPGSPPVHPVTKNLLGTIPLMVDSRSLWVSEPGNPVYGGRDQRPLHIHFVTNCRHRFPCRNEGQGDMHVWRLNQCQSPPGGVERAVTIRERMNAMRRAGVEDHDGPVARHRNAAIANTLTAAHLVNIDHGCPQHQRRLVPVPQHTAQTNREPALWVPLANPGVVLRAEVAQCDGRLIR